MTNLLLAAKLEKARRIEARQKTKRKPRIQNADTELARKHLKHFLRQAWPVIEPDTPLLDNWHIDYLCEYLESVTLGQILRLVINIPPRYMKSTIVTIMWPVWEWLQRPSLRYLFNSYNADLMTDHSVARRNIIESDWFQARFSDCFHLSPDQNQKTKYSNNHRGVMNASAKTTGKGGNRVIVDDPHDPMGAESDTIREGELQYFRTVLSTRLNNKKEDAIVVVMQRLHEKDVSGLCIDLGYTHVNVPVWEEKRTVVDFPLTLKEIVREPLELLWPLREDWKEIKAVQLLLGSYAFSGQYLQNPAPPGGGIVKREWFKFYRSIPGRFDEILQSWDMSFKGKETSDHVAGQVWGRLGADYYLLDYVDEIMTFTAAQQAMRSMAAKWPNVKKKLVEDAANGPAIEESLNREIGGIILTPANGSKAERLHAVAPDVEAGNVFLPMVWSASTGQWRMPFWCEDFVRLCTMFPKSGHDDPVDAFTQAILGFKKPTLGKGKGGRVSQNSYLGQQGQQGQRN